MRGPHNIWRLMVTGATLERTGAMRILFEAMEAPAILRLLFRGLAWPVRWMGERGDASLPPVPRALQALGPAYIKFGQILSTRPDVIGSGLARQMMILQDRLPPFPTETAKEMVAEELGAEVETLFSEFSPPVAAASIAQVHRARIAETGEEVAVKVLRPRVERAFRRDIDAFYFAAGMIEVLMPGTRRLRPHDVVEHFEGVVRGELDLRLEAAAASEFAATTAEDPGLIVPEVRWHLSSRHVLTLDWAEGIAISDIEALDAAGHDRVRIAGEVLELFLSHALRDGYFHADMHQGNLKVSADGKLIALDFGIMGRIDAYTRRVYAEILFGFMRRDYHRVAEVHFEAGYVPSNRDVDEFARALRAVGEPIFGMDATHISMGRLLSQLFEVTERFGMQTRTELILLQRTMVVVEGVARSLDPHINIWQAARPVVEDYIRKNIGPVAAIADLGRTLRVLARFGPRLPMLVEERLLRPPPAPVPARGWSGLTLVLTAAGSALAAALLALWLG
jgi:ubiquinone biosynthesis protein